MPMTLEEFRKLGSIPTQSGVKSRKCNWDEVLNLIQGKAWKVAEVWEIAKANSRDQSISRVRTKRWLDALVKKGIAVGSVDGVAFVYWVNPGAESTKKAVVSTPAEGPKVKGPNEAIPKKVKELGVEKDSLEFLKSRGKKV